MLDLGIKNSFFYAWLFKEARTFLLFLVQNFKAALGIKNVSSFLSLGAILGTPWARMLNPGSPTGGAGPAVSGFLWLIWTST